MLLPLITLPPQESIITAVLLPPATVRLHIPFHLVLRITNGHPTVPASSLSIQVDTNESFVWHGNRSARIPTVQPGETGEVRLELMAVVGTGWYALPGVKIWEGEGERSSEIRVVEGREGGRKEGSMVLVRP